jgi:hypothetical protein
MAKPDTYTEASALDAYSALLVNAQTMLKAAKESRWDDLTVCQVERESCLANLVENDLVSTRPAYVESRGQLIQSILECDEQTKQLVHARHSELAELLGSMGNERKLADAYRDA